MNAEVFLDTNIIIYAYAEQEIAKFEAANRLIDNGRTVTSTQVFNELSATLARKFWMTWRQIGAVVNELTQRCAVTELSIATIQSAIHLAERYGCHYYDSLILATALERNCSILFTEDLQHQQVIANRLVVLNPFLL